MRKETLLLTRLPELPEELAACAKVMPSEQRVEQVRSKAKGEYWFRTGALIFTAGVISSIIGKHADALSAIWILLLLPLLLYVQAGSWREYHDELDQAAGGGFLAKHLGDLRRLLRDREILAARLADLDHHTRKDMADTLALNESVRLQTECLLGFFRRRFAANRLPRFRNAFELLKLHRNREAIVGRVIAINPEVAESLPDHEP